MPIQYILRVDDVGRIPGDDPEEGSDGDLSYFARWREESGLAGLPVVYGVVPMWINYEGKGWLRNHIKYPEKIAIHGFDHRQGAEVTLHQMRLSIDSFTTDCAPYSYIPPFNTYSEKTLRDWQEAGGKYFFGGFNREHHKYGLAPCHPTIHPLQGLTIWHISAYKPLYAHAVDLPYWIHNDTMSFPYPKVITLHVPWDKDISKARDVVNMVREKLVSVDTIT